MDVPYLDHLKFYRSLNIPAADLVSESESKLLMQNEFSAKRY